jgi:hypothetical protein
VAQPNFPLSLSQCSQNHLSSTALANKHNTLTYQRNQTIKMKQTMMTTAAFVLSAVPILAFAPGQVATQLRTTTMQPLYSSLSLHPQQQHDPKEHLPFFAAVQEQHQQPVMHEAAQSSSSSLEQQQQQQTVPSRKAKSTPTKKKFVEQQQQQSHHKQGILSPIVLLAKQALGQDDLNKLRAKVISMHSDVIAAFVETSDSKVGQTVLKTLFQAADVDGNGLVDETELARIFHMLGFDWLQDKQVQGILKRADADANGAIDLEEFLMEAPKTLRTNLIKLAKKNGGELGLLA